MKMCAIILFLSLLYSGYTSALHLPRCPYPVAEDIEPCICRVDEHFRLVLTCNNLESDLTEESFNRVTKAFDYNNEIYSFMIDLKQYSYPYDEYKFYPQLNAENLGRLNVTHFSLKNADIVSLSLFGEGAFDGSAGSVQNITVEDITGVVDLGSHVLHPACPTLLSLKLERVSQLSSTSFINSPNLELVSLRNSRFPVMPSSLFSAENVPKMQYINIGVQDNLSLQTDSLKNLQNLTNLEISATKIDIIQSYALNNLPSLESLQMDGMNIIRIEEDAFKDLIGLTSFSIANSDIEVLPRIFSNSPSLKSFTLRSSQLAIIEENAFKGVPNLEYLDLDLNAKLLELKLTNMNNLTEINLGNDDDLFSVNISNMPMLNTIIFVRNKGLSSVALDNLPSLAKLEFQNLNNKEPLSIDIANCQNLSSLDAAGSNLVSLSLENVAAITNLELNSNLNLNHSGLGSSLHSIQNFEAHVNLRYTNVRYLEKLVFSSLLETFTSVESSSGYIDLYDIRLDCGCDVKWIIDDFHFQTEFFRNAKCVDGTSLADVDPILLEMMCPPEK